MAPGFKCLVQIPMWLGPELDRQCCVRASGLTLFLVAIQFRTLCCLLGGLPGPGGRKFPSSSEQAVPPELCCLLEA